MLLLLQAIATQAQAIKVEVTKLPAVPGMSEWAKTLISAGVGAVFAILTGAVTEVIKSRQARSGDLKELKRQIIPELRENLDQVETFHRMAKRAGEGSKDDRSLALTLGKSIVAPVSSDRYNLCFEKQKALVYEIDPQKTLQSFYSLVASAQAATVNLDYASVIHYLRRASEEGRAFLAAHEVVYAPKPDSNWDRYVSEPRPGVDNPESWFHELTKTGAFATNQP